MNYWYAEVAYDGCVPFHFSSSEMYIKADSELEAERLLVPIVEKEWAKISPHLAPTLKAVHKGRYILI